MGQHAKTDPLDAALIADYAAHTQPKAIAKTSPALAALVTTDATLTRLRTLLLAAQEHSEDLALQAVQQVVQAQQQALAAKLKAALAEDARATLLQSIPGLGPKSSAVLLARLPELGSADAEGLVALAGLAPHARASGGWLGKRFIQGGRAEVRKALYMATLSAVRCGKGPLGGHYAGLRARGKAPKVALVACMRKLLLIANAVLRKNTPFTS